MNQIMQISIEIGTQEMIFKWYFNVLKKKNEVLMFLNGISGIWKWGFNDFKWYFRGLKMRV